MVPPQVGPRLRLSKHILSGLSLAGTIALRPTLHSFALASLLPIRFFFNIAHIDENLMLIDQILQILWQNYFHPLSKILHIFDKA